MSGGNESVKRYLADEIWDRRGKSLTVVSVVLLAAANSGPCGMFDK
jgi:hypothetical protein